MNEFSNYALAEKVLIQSIVNDPHFVTKTTHERFGTGFTLLDPTKNQNGRSNYDYAEDFFKWMMSGEKELNEAVLRHNPWVRRFVDNTGLPSNFSSSYGWKIVEQLPVVIKELKAHPESRRAYINILIPDDKVILDTVTTHEFPCTLGLQLFLRNDQLHMIANMRSNNVWSVMPYDVYNFTMLQIYLAGRLGVTWGTYYHQVNNAHIFKGDVRRIKDKDFLNTQNVKSDENHSRVSADRTGGGDSVNQDASEFTRTSNGLISPFQQAAREYARSSADHSNPNTRPSTAISDSGRNGNY